MLCGCVKFGDRICHILGISLLLLACSSNLPVGSRRGNNDGGNRWSDDIRTRGLRSIDLQGNQFFCHVCGISRAKEHCTHLSPVSNEIRGDVFFLSQQDRRDLISKKVHCLRNKFPSFVYENLAPCNPRHWRDALPETNELPFEQRRTIEKSGIRSFGVFCLDVIYNHRCDGLHSLVELSGHFIYGPTLFENVFYHRPNIITNARFVVATSRCKANITRTAASDLAGWHWNLREIGQGSNLQPVSSNSNEIGPEKAHHSRWEQQRGRKQDEGGKFHVSYIRDNYTGSASVYLEADGIFYSSSSLDIDATADGKV